MFVSVGGLLPVVQVVGRASSVMCRGPSYDKDFGKTGIDGSADGRFDVGCGLVDGVVKVG